MTLTNTDWLLSKLTDTDWHRLAAPTDTDWHRLTLTDAGWHLLNWLAVVDTVRHLPKFADISWHWLAPADTDWHLVIQTDIFRHWMTLTVGSGLSGSNISYACMWVIFTHNIYVAKLLKQLKELSVVNKLVYCNSWHVRKAGKESWQVCSRSKLEAVNAFVVVIQLWALFN